IEVNLFDFGVGTHHGVRAPEGNREHSIGDQLNVLNVGFMERLLPDECPHLIVFDDTEVESLMFAGAGARWAALESWKKISTSWNAHLFVRVARNSRDDRNPCATVTDPAEVKRLHEEVSAYKESRERLHEWLREEQLESIALHAQLAERDGHLENALDVLKNVDDLDRTGEGVKSDIERMLSASAEPSAGKKQALQAEASLGIERLPVGPSAPKCKFCGGDGYRHEPRSPGVDCTACNCTGIQQGADLVAWYEAHLRKISAEPSVPVEIDERVCKGAWELGAACGKCSRCKASAALERKPVEPLPPVDGDLLPPIGSKVLIRLGREDAWVERTVVGYYVWGNHGLDQNVHRVFVRVRDAEGYLNARLLGDVCPVATERKP
ncbi:hypothetical protein G7007_17940, partial [Pseudomonas entomophila]|uniref:hypothetical protein n=1 Tax=Pseudomonas entomophila TaxID=312306 RepID=UPI0015E2A970